MGADRTHEIGRRVMFRSGPYGDGRDKRLLGRIIEGPREISFDGFGQAWLVRGEPAVTSPTGASSLFSDGVWMEQRLLTVIDGEMSRS